MNFFLVLLATFLFVTACTTKPISTVKTVSETPSEPTKSATKKSSIVVDEKDLALLDQMNKAVEEYVLKKEIKKFKTLCQNSHFDCYVNDKAFPKKRRKNTRSVPPYASGSKMGLHGEERVQVRYDFYP